MQENEIEKKLKNQVEAAHGLCLKFTSPGNNGVPDRILLFPNGRIAFVEVKAPGKKPRKLQQYWLETLARFGFPCMVLDHPEQIADKENQEDNSVNVSECHADIAEYKHQCRTDDRERKFLLQCILADRQRRK